MERRDFQQLTRQEEVDAAKAMEAGDTDARRRLIESQIGWAKQIAYRRARKCFIEREELESVAFVALVHAVDLYDYRHNVRLTTYVFRAIDWAITKLIRKMSTPLSRSENFPTNPARAAAYVAASNRDFVADFRVIKQLEVDHGRQHDGVTWAEVSAAIDQLPERERDLIRRRLAGGSLQTVGDALGVTRKRIRQIEKRAVGRLREQLAEK